VEHFRYIIRGDIVRPALGSFRELHRILKETV
jgi:hypothetical protein